MRSWKGIYAKVEKYGVEEVPAARRHELFNQLTRLDDEGFSEVRQGFYVRPAGEEVFDVLSHHASGQSTFVWWGVSLSYVPHEFGRRVRFQRTLQAAHLDLFEWNVDDEADFGYTETPWLRELQGMWQRAWPRAQGFWRRAVSPRGSYNSPKSWRRLQRLTAD